MSQKRLEAAVTRTGDGVATAICLIALTPFIATLWICYLADRTRSNR